MLNSASASIPCEGSGSGFPSASPSENGGSIAEVLRAEVDSASRAACSRIAPMWGLDSFVAVNPYWGFRGSSFLSTAQSLREYSDAALLMPAAHYRERFNRGDFSKASVAQSIATLKRTGQLGSEVDEAEMLQDALQLLRAPVSPVESLPILLSIAEVYDCRMGSSYEPLITEEIGRFCALYFDRGQAAWSFLGKHTDMFSAWKLFATTDRTLEIRGVPAARHFFKALPTSYSEVLVRLSAKLGMPAPELQELLTRELFAIKGWAAYAQHLVFEDAKRSVESTRVLELLAIKAAYGLLLLENAPHQGISDQIRDSARLFCASQRTPSRTTTLLLLFQEALEVEFVHGLTAKLTPASSPSKTAPALQALFCIDVRSEGFRRALESQSNEIQTYGFAGFFGLAFDFNRCGATLTDAQYPVLLSAQFSVNESSVGLSWCSKAKSAFSSRTSALVRIVRQSISSGFSYVEGFGGLYALKMLKDTVRAGINLRAPAVRRDSTHPLDIGMSLSQKIDAAAGILKTTGLRQPYASIVLLCGHRSSNVNNPYAGGLDCGACGGHGGEINARVAAAILNDVQVRDGLRVRGIEIAPDTQFIAGVHDTTLDRVELLSEFASEPSAESAALRQAQNWLTVAGTLARRSRFTALGILDTSEETGHRHIAKRAADWSEVRPEWGLAGNAAFIVARRERTRSAALGNRCFLHEYDHTRDADSSILELIMTAPMIVASWINLQYYGSTVAPDVFGSGDKVTHNVVGQLGVVRGNGGDLQLGLPWQSVHTGERPFHEPLRLQVVIEAPLEKIAAVVKRHELLQQMIFNQWISVFALDSESSTLHRVEGPVVG